MKNKINSNDAAFTPQTHKTFVGALEAFLAYECPQMAGKLSRQVLANSILTMVHKFYPETSNMRQGQVIWATVDRDETSAWGKSMRQTKLTVVRLDLVLPTDAQDRANGKKIKEINKEAIARMCKQAYAQGGCLTTPELAILLKLALSTIGKYIKEWENENNEVLPRRGSIHDLGPTLTHKRIIIQKIFLEQKTVQQVSRETCHSLPAIQRYISMFKQVLLCRQKGMSTEEIAFAVKATTRLVREYEKIIDEYKENNHIVEAMLKYGVATESG